MTNARTVLPIFVHAYEDSLLYGVFDAMLRGTQVTTAAVRVQDMHALIASENVGISRTHSE